MDIYICIISQTRINVNVITALFFYNYLADSLVAVPKITCYFCHGNNESLLMVTHIKSKVNLEFCWYDFYFLLLQTIMKLTLPRVFGYRKDGRSLFAHFIHRPCREICVEHFSFEITSNFSAKTKINLHYKSRLTFLP